MTPPTLVHQLMALRVWLQVYSRAMDWEPVTLNDSADVVELPEFGLRCTVGDLYRHAPFEPGRTAARKHGSMR
jgi:hypothetical protein